MDNATIQHKRTYVSGLLPTTSQVAVGELALNLTENRLYTSNGSVIIDLNRTRPRTTTIASSSTPTPNYDTEDKFFITALAQNATFGAPIGTVTEGSMLLIRVRDNSTPRILAWNAVYRASIWLPLPTVTSAGKTMNIGFTYNAADSKWDLLALIDGL